MTASADSSPLVRGVFAAMTLPRSSAGVLDLDAFATHLGFISRAGIRGFALNGATGEYCLTTTDELTAVLQSARSVAGPGATLMAGVGAASLVQTMERVQAAEAAGADGLLLPMPHYFPYQQQDLEAFAAAVAERSKLPMLLYNLPKFTTPLEARTTLSLIQKCPQIRGIKDSSGSLDTVRLLKAQAPRANRVIGNDSALYNALAQGLCDGVVSGVACVLPELMQALYASAALDSRSAESLGLKAALDEFIDCLGWFPVPWGLKIVAEARGLSPAEFPLPLSPERAAKRKQFAAWFKDHRASLLAETDAVVSSRA